MKRRVLFGFGTLAACYLAVCALMFAVQRKLLFPAPTGLARAYGGLEREEVPGGTFLLWTRVPGEGAVVVHFHGNGEQVGNLGWLAAEWAERGVSFVAVEYPGYPGAAGTPSEESLLQASEAALQHLTGALKIERSRLVLEGQSVGTGVAVTLASRGWGTRLLLISPYTSLPAVGAKAFPWLPVGLLMRDRFDSLSRAPELKVPTLILHGTIDAVVPFELGEALSRAIPGAKFVAVEGAGHNDLFDRDQTLQVMADFVALR